MPKQDPYRISLDSADTVGSAWELFFIGRVRPAKLEKSQHSAECIFVRRELNGNIIGPRLLEFSSCWIGVNSLPAIKPGEIWFDELVGSIPMRVPKPNINNPSLEEIRLSLFNPQAAYENEIQFFFDEPLPEILNEVGGMMALQLFGKKTGGPSFYTIIVPSIEFHRFLMFLSDELCNALFHVGFGKLYDPDRSFFQAEDNEEPFVKIVSDVALKNSDLKYLAKTLGDPTYRYLRARIAGGIRAGGNEPRYLYARIFWMKKTKIRVKGFAIPRNDNGGEIFIVQSIEHTTHKPSFNKIIYHLKSTVISSSHTDPDSLMFGGGHRLHSGGELPQSDENWPANETSVAQHNRTVPSSLDDWEPSIDRRDILSNKDSNAESTSRPSDDSTAEDLSSGITGSSSSKTGRIRIGININDDEADHPFERFQRLWKVCEDIAQNMNGAMRPVVGSAEAVTRLMINNEHRPLNRIANYAKNPWNRFFRRSLMIELLIQRKHFYLVEIEEVLRGDSFSLALLTKESFGPLSIAEIDQFFGSAARVRFAWRDRDDASDDRKKLRQALNDFLKDKNLFPVVHSSHRTSPAGLQNYIELKIRNMFRAGDPLHGNLLH